MMTLVRAELRKTSTTRISWTMPVAMFLVGGLFAALQGFALVSFGEIPGPDGQTIAPVEAFGETAIARLVYTGGFQFGYLLALVLGILSMSGEFRHQTITGTLLSTPRRGRLILGKLLALAVVVTLNGLAFIAGSLVGGGLILLSGDVALFPDAGGLVLTLLRLLLVLVLWGLIGFGLGVLITNQVIALFAGIAIALLVEPLLSFLIQFLDPVAEAARYFPSQATTAALDLYAGVDAEAADIFGGGDLLTWWVAALVLLGYALVMTVIGWVVTTRRDVA
ncbi:ABC transporter permease subunit [Serinicoccus marinus]|uniref:ABC transporter permease subunit n=1 Tax=Serinicoccus marinus TaxID=247333 RepID=UPI0003B4B73E|nr:ABC transporter permease subunit [Serinicoccus marinus]